jgi:hypothetical protein
MPFLGRLAVVTAPWLFSKHDGISGTRMSDLQDLHRWVSRALFSFAPSIVGTLASSECQERCVIAHLSSGIRRSLSQAGALPNSQPPTPAEAAVGGAQRLRLCRTIGERLMAREGCGKWGAMPSRFPSLYEENGGSGGALDLSTFLSDLFAFFAALFAAFAVFRSCLVFLDI